MNRIKEYTETPVGWTTPEEYQEIVGIEYTEE